MQILSLYNDINPIPANVITSPVICAGDNLDPNIIDPIIKPAIEITLNTADAHGKSMDVREVHPHNKLPKIDVKIGHHQGIMPTDIALAIAEPVIPIMNKKAKIAGDTKIIISIIFK